MVLMSSYGLEKLIDEPTRIQNDSSTCIDHVFYRLKNEFQKKKEYSVHHYGISDHAFISVKFHIPIQSKQRNASPNSIIKTDFNKLNDLLFGENWEIVYGESNTALAFKYFLTILTAHINNCSYRYNIKSEKKLKPWISTSLVRKINYKNDIVNKSKKSPNNSHLKNLSKKLCKKMRNECELAREQYYNDKFNRNHNNMKENWSTVNEILGEQKERSHKVELKVGNQTYTDTKIIANKFNNYFSNIAKSLRDDYFNNNPIFQSDLILQHQIGNSFVFTEILPSELFKIIATLDNKSSIDVFGLSNIAIKRIAFNIVDVLSYLFNMCVLNGVFPDQLKQTIVLPLFKKGCKYDMENYRPISLSPVIAKLLEKCVKVRMVKFLEKNSILGEQQFGFRKGRSTEGAITQLLEFINSALEKKDRVAAIFLDVSKAFDTVDHPLLLKKLFNVGFRGIFLAFMESFLSNRTQTVKIGDSFSDIAPVKYGVPQGTVLGPILFLVYVNSLYHQHTNAEIVSFADDMVFLYRTQTIENLKENIKQDTVKIREWFDSHYLIISSKSKLMSFYLSDQRCFSLNVIFHNPDCNGNCC